MWKFLDPSGMWKLASLKYEKIIVGMKNHTVEEYKRNMCEGGAQAFPLKE